jgi:hypothetical protein
MRLATLLSNWRWAEQITLRTAAAEIGVSIATLRRVENGYPMDGRTLAKIFNWMTGAPKR